MSGGPRPSGSAPSQARQDGERRLAEALNQAVALHRAGQRDQAKKRYQEIRRRFGKCAAATHYLGAIAFEEGRPDEAISLMEQAIEEDPSIPAHFGNLAEVHRKLGNLDRAIDLSRKALQVYAVYPGALNTLGLALLARGDLEEAEQALRKAIEFRPDYAPAHAALGNVLRARGAPDRAVRAFKRALRRDPGMVDAQLALGATLSDLGRMEEALDAYREGLKIASGDARLWANQGVVLARCGRRDEAIDSFRKATELAPQVAALHLNHAKALMGARRTAEALDAFRRAAEIGPGLAEAHFGIGCCYESLERWNEAASAYREALEIQPDFHLAQNNLGTTLLAAGDYEGARAAFSTLLKMKHGLGAMSAAELLQMTPSSERVLRTTRFALLDRAEQIEHLVAIGAVESAFGELAARCRAVRDELPEESFPQRRVALDPGQVKRVAGLLDKTIYVQDAARCMPHAVNPELDFASLEDAFLGDADPAVPFDNFLTPEALAGLQEFCLRSTIYFNADPAGFVASSLADGFNCSLLYQIAEDLKGRLPRVIGPRHLSNMWVYRHAAEGGGVQAHTDHSAVTFNFWITPDEANLDPDHGGLILYKAREPLDWDWREINTRKYDPEVRGRIDALVESSECVVIPYRCNRAVLFASNLFHMSDRFHFAEGFENRRINITMLFGRWGTGPGHTEPGFLSTGD